MFTHWFTYLMAGTLLLAVITMVAGVANLGQVKPEGTEPTTRGNTLMFLRVGLCLLLLVQIVIYITYIKP